MLTDASTLLTLGKSLFFSLVRDPARLVLSVDKCIIIRLMFISLSDCHKDSCFVGIATFLAPGTESDIWWMPRKYSLNGEMNHGQSLSPVNPEILLPQSQMRLLHYFPAS